MPEPMDQDYAMFIAASKSTICDNWMWELPLRVSIGRMAHSLGGAHVLDIGCGRGLILEFLASHGARVIGLDRWSSSYWRNNRHALHYVRGTAEKLPFRNSVFDVVLSCSTMQYVNHSDVFMEIVRVVKDGGIVVLHENMPYNPVILLYRMRRKLGALFSPATRAYLSSIKDYLSPDFTFPAEMALEGHCCYYLLSPILLLMGRNSKRTFTPFARFLFHLDTWLVHRSTLFQKLCWFCSYSLKVSKSKVLQEDSPELG